MALESKELLRQFKAAAWGEPAQVHAFLEQAAGPSAADVGRLLGALTERGASADPRHKLRTQVLQKLAEPLGDKELFGAYVRALRSADPILRKVLVELLPRVNHIPGHGELCSLLRSPDAGLRAGVAQVLKSVCGKTGFELLAELAAEPEFPGRVEVMDVLTSLGKHQAVAALAQVLEVGSVAERLAAVRHLGDPQLMAKGGAAASQALAEAFSDPEPQVAAAAVAAFAQQAGEAEFFATVEPLLDAADPLRVQPALLALQHQPSARSLALLEKRLRLGPTSLCLTALESLEAMASVGGVPVIAGALQHPEPEVRGRAAEHLVRLVDTGALEPARAVFHLLRSREPGIQRLAQPLVRKAGDAQGTLWPRVLTMLREESWWTREALLDALVATAGPALARPAVSLLKDASPALRRWALELVRRLNEPAALRALLHVASADADWWVRDQALSVIATLGDERAVPHLLALLEKDVATRRSCLEALAALKVSAAPQLVALLADEDPDVRLAALHCLDVANDPACAGAVRALADDPSPPARSLARELLQRWKQPEVEAASRLSPLDQLLVALAQNGGDDLFLAGGEPAQMKKLGQVAALTRKPLPAAQLEAQLLAIVGPAQQQQLAALQDVDLSYEVKSEGLRFRGNIFRQKSGLSAVFRIVKNAIPELEKLGLPKVVGTLGNLRHGLVLVGGPTGSGKSTTLAGIINQINATSSRHILTLEDPIEVIHARKRCLVTQREIGTHTQSFGSALRATLREDPDVILVGELRDLATISFAVTAAETGHLVFGTLHTVSADSSVDRLINAFPPAQQPQVRSMLAESLRAVVCQQLVRRVDRPGERALAVEVMLNNEAIANLIRKGKSFQIASMLTTHREAGMQSMDSELRRLLEAGQISPEEAYMKAVNKKDFEDCLHSGGTEPAPLGHTIPLARAANRTPPGTMGVRRLELAPAEPKPDAPAAPPAQPVPAPRHPVFKIN